MSVTAVAATATRCVDDAFPYWIEVEFADADGATVTVVDKAPVFGVGYGPTTAYPAPVALECEVLRHETPGVAVVALSNGVSEESEVRVAATSFIATD
jgi:hypothetical protein